MNLTTVFKRSVRFLRMRNSQTIGSINLGVSSINPHFFSSHSTPSLSYYFPMVAPMDFNNMQESLNELWEGWRRSESEDRVAIIEKSLVPQIKNALIFRFLTRKSIGVKDLEAALNSIWRTNAPANFFAIGEGIFLVGFENSVDCNKVLAWQPWQFNNSLMVFKKAEGNERIVDLVLKEVPLWVQAHGLELQLLTRYMGELLGHKIGRVLEVDCSTNSLA